MDCQGNPTSYIVNTFEDEVDANDNRLSLREAVVLANNDTDCNLILLPRGVYELDRQDSAEVLGGDLNVVKRAELPTRLVTIRAQESTSKPESTVIRGAWEGATHRLITVGVEASLALEGLTLERGQTSENGGAIYNRGKLAITNSILQSNYAGKWGGAVASLPEDPNQQLEIKNTLFQFNQTGGEAGGHGGAIVHLGGRLKLENSTIFQNMAKKRAGGVLVAAGTATITNSTITTNTAGASGGGIYVSAGATATILSSTIYANAASGTTAAGGIDTDGDLDPQARSVFIQNSIVAGNGVWHSVESNQLLEVGANLRGNVQSNFGNVFGDVTGLVHPQIRKEDLTFRNPRLEALRRNGGLTPTHALRPGSPAVGNGLLDSDPPNKDQNGNQRGAKFSSGAVEFLNDPDPDPDPDPLAGDTNDDGVVDILDLNNVRNTFGARDEGALGDTNGDSIVDIADLNNVRNNFGAVRQPAAAKPAEEIDVTDWSRCRADQRYCAIPDDGRDDTFAIQAALNDARVRGESHVRVPKGTFDAQELTVRGYAIGLVGEGTLRLPSESDSYALLTLAKSPPPQGVLPELAVTRSVVMRDAFTPANWVDGIAIDGNGAAPHQGKSIGLFVEGDSYLISNVIVRDTALDATSDTNPYVPAGINVLVRGDNNVLSNVDSLDAGHTAFRNVGGENWYYDISARGFGCRGFRAQVPNSDEFGVDVIEGGPIYLIGAEDGGEIDFDSSTNGIGCGRGNAPASILIDPVPVEQPDSEKRITRVELRRLDVDGPDNIDPVSGQGNVLKFAAVEQMIIDGSRFVHTSPRMHSIRVAEGTIETLPSGAKVEKGTIRIANSWLARNLFFENVEGEPRYENIRLENVRIGEAVGNASPEDRKYAIENVRALSYFQADRLELSNFSVSGISWALPSAFEVTNSEFRGKSLGVVYGLTTLFLPAETQCSRFTWLNNEISNSPGGALELPPPPLFKCELPIVGSAATATAVIDAAFEQFDGTDLLAWMSAQDEPPTIESLAPRKKR